MAVSAIAIPCSSESATSATTRPAAALRTTMLRCAPCSPSITRRTTSALKAGVPPVSSVEIAGARPRATGSTVKVRTCPSRNSRTVDGPVVVSSSRPPPCTTHDDVAPCKRKDANIFSATKGFATPMSWRLTRPGLAIGPNKLKTVGTPISRRAGAAKRKAG